MSTKALISNQKGQQIGIQHDGYVNSCGVGLFLLNHVSTIESVNQLFSVERCIYYGMFNQKDEVFQYSQLDFIENNYYHRFRLNNLKQDVFRLNMLDIGVGLKDLEYELTRKSTHRNSKWLKLDYPIWNFNDFIRSTDYSYYFDGSIWNIEINVKPYNIEVLKSIDDFKPFLMDEYSKIYLPLELFQKHFNDYNSETDFKSLYYKK